MQPKTTVEQRKRNIPAAVDRRKPIAVELNADASVPGVNEDETTAFKAAMDRYKRENRRPFPTWSEVLEVLRAMGYRKVGEQTDLPVADRRQSSTPIAHDRRRSARDISTEDGTDEVANLPPKG